MISNVIEGQINRLEWAVLSLNDAIKSGEYAKESAVTRYIESATLFIQAAEKDLKKARQITQTKENRKRRY